MRAAWIWTMVVMAVVAAGCQQDKETPPMKQQPTGGEATANCPEARPLADATGWDVGRVENLKAWRSGGAIVVQASGMKPTPGHTVQLARTGGKTPELTIYWKAPEGPVAAVLEPYETCVTLPGTGNVNEVTVVTAEGRRTVKVGG